MLWERTLPSVDQYGKLYINMLPLILHSDTSVHDIEESFKSFVSRSDIAIILINQNYAELIRHLLDNHTEPVPAILEIPSKDSPYDPSKDSILRRAKVGNLQDTCMCVYHYIVQSKPV